MRIALLTNHPENTGVGRYAFTLFKTLCKVCNYEVSLFELSRSDHTLYLATNDMEKIPIKFVKKNIFFDNFAFAKCGISNLFFDYRIGQFVLDSYNIYHLTNQVFSNLSYYKNIKNCVITVHDLDYYTHPLNKLQKILSKLVYKGIYKVKYIIAISKSTKNVIVRYFGIPEDRVEVIYHGVDEIFRPLNEMELGDIYSKYNLSKDFNYILHVGADLPRKNFITLLKAFYKLLNDYNSKLKVRLIKLGEININIRNLIKSLNLEKYVKVISSVTEEDLVKLYNLAYVFVFPSFHEGFGFPVLEAMACGTPVISSNASSLPEIVDDTGILINPDDVNRLSEAIYNVLMDDNLRKELSKRGLKRARKFTWETCAKKTLKIYEEVFDND